MYSAPESEDSLIQAGSKLQVIYGFLFLLKEKYFLNSR